VGARRRSSRDPARSGLASLYLACLATAYALYTAAFVLALAAGAMLAEDAFAPDGSRRRTARRFLLLSPAFGLALWLGYLPWWPVVRDFASRPPVAAAPPLTLARVGRIVTFFAFASDDTWRLGAAGALFALLAAAGLAVALARRGTRCLAAWGIGGLAGIEGLGRIHPHYDFVRRFVPAGPGLTALAAVALAALLARPVTRLAGAALLAAVLVLDGRGLRVYFLGAAPTGGPWPTTCAPTRTPPSASSPRTSTRSSAPPTTSSVRGGSRTSRRSGPVARDLPNLEGETVRLTWAWRPGARAWLVLAGEPRHPELRRWAEAFPGIDFPKAEGAVLRRLDPDRRDASPRTNIGCAWTVSSPTRSTT
jgi:hypothetical protein